jgi:pimeloyl-ACP methyl ester carboxylesterase
VILPPTQSGCLRGRLPFVRLGKGKQTVVFFPGLGDALWDVTTHVWDLPLHYRAFTKHFTVYLLSRKRGLPAGYTTREMAADYAEAFEHDIGPANVVGISLGGYVAQHLAAEYPQHVQRLVTACAAYRVSEAGRKIPERWLALAREQRWREFYFDVAKVTVEEYHHTFYQFLFPLFRHPAADPADFLVSLGACLSHDGRELLGRIKAPTLVIGGAEDRFFPEPLLRETAQQIADARLVLIEHAHHGADEDHKRSFESAVIQFIRNGA